MKKHSILVLSWLSALILAGVFLALLVPLIASGAPELSLNYLFERPTEFGLKGGIGPVLVSTLLILLVAVVAAFFPAFATATFLYFHTQTQPRLAHFILGCLKLLASIPSVVFGMFGMVLFCEWLGLGYSILSGGLTLSVMIIPILCFTFYSSMQSFPLELRLAAEGLGLKRWTFVHRLLVPYSSRGLAAGLVLGITRSISETAALIFTSGYATRYPQSLLDSGRSLSLHIYELGINVSGGDARGCAAALTLLILILLINVPVYLFFRLSSPASGSSRSGSTGNAKAVGY